MKKSRIINWSMWGTIALFCSVMVATCWYKGGCEWWQIAIAILVYCYFCFALGYTIDAELKDE